MLHRICLVLCFSFLFGHATCASETADTQWHLTGKLNTPKILWQRLTQIAEIKPVYDACQADVQKLLLSGEFASASWEIADTTIFFAVSSKKNDAGSETSFWSQGPDKSTRFLGSFPSFDYFVSSIILNHRNESGDSSKELELPKQCLELDENSLLHVKIVSATMLNQLEKDLVNELTLDNKKLESSCRQNIRTLNRRLKKGEIKGDAAAADTRCPLNGQYRLNASDGRFACNHVVTVPDYRKMSLEGAARQALIIIEILENISDIDIKISEPSENLVVELGYNQKAQVERLRASSNFPELSWFEDLKNFDRFSPGVSMHLALTPDLIGFFTKVSTMDPDISQLLAGKSPAEILPEKMVVLSMTGGFDPFSMRLPDSSISLGLSAAKVATIKALLQDSGAPVKFDTCELNGRDIEVLEIPELGHQFNSAEVTDNRIFILPDTDARVKICLGREACLRQLALDSGESPAVSLWHDIKAPLKLAMAYRLETIAAELLKLANQAHFEVERGVCQKNVNNWRQANREIANSLKEGMEIPQDLKKCCGREAIMLSEQPGQIECAVHSHGNTRRINNQFYKVDIASDRWLRLYSQRGEGKSKLVFDVIKAREVE